MRKRQLKKKKKINRGKQFENQIREGFNAIQDVDVERLKDPMSRYKGDANICDFIVYKYPYEYRIECKSVYGDRLPYSNISKTQWEGLFSSTKLYGVCAGVICWFIDHDITVFIPIKELQRLKDEYPKKKSFSIKDCSRDDINLYILNGKKRKILFDYDMTEFFERITYDQIR